MAAIPARDEKRFEPGESTSAAAPQLPPHLERALQAAAAARARTARIRAESGSPNPPSKPPTGTPRDARPRSSVRLAPVTARGAVPAPAAPPQHHMPRDEPRFPPRAIPPAIERRFPDPEPPAASPVVDTGPEPPGPSAAQSHDPEPPVSPAVPDTEPETPAASAGPGHDPVPPAPPGPAPDAGRPRFQRTRAAAANARLAGHAVEVREPDGETASSARKVLDLIRRRRATPTAPAAEPEAAGDPEPAAHPSRRRAATAPLLEKDAADGARRAGAARADAPCRQDPGPDAGARAEAMVRAIRAGASSASPVGAATDGGARSGPEPAPAASGRPAVAARPAPRALTAAWRSVRNHLAFAVGVVIGALLLAGFEHERALDLVRAFTSMQPPRVVRVEKILTVDLPPAEPIAIAAAAAPPATRPATTESDAASATGGGDVLAAARAAGRNDPRVADLVAVATGDPSRWDAFYELGHIFEDRGDLAAAIPLYRRAASVNPWHPAIVYDLGYALQRQGDYPAAIAQYRATLELSPSHPYALYNLGSLLELQGEPEAAIGYFERASREQGSNAYVHYGWARALEALGRTDEAIARYRRAAALSPDRRPGPDSLARIDELLTVGG